jgi:PGAP1-like protein
MGGHTKDAVRGMAALVFDAVDATTGIVEGMHANIAAAPSPFGAGTDLTTRGIAGLVYRSIRLVNDAVRWVTDVVLRLSGGADAPPASEREWDAVRSAINGVVGDHLVESGNPLAIPMTFRRRGRSLPLDRQALAAAVPDATAKILLLVHGLCMSDRQWERRGHDHGAALAHELGFTPVYVHYNSGRHVSHNGRELADLLERLLAAWPVDAAELTILAHSMGGLVARSAHHLAVEAERRWPGRLRRMMFLGTPHHGTLLERAGNRLQWIAGISPYTAPLSRLGMLRSAGITDLRFGNLCDEDWNRCDRFATVPDYRRCVPLPADVDCYAVAGTLRGIGARRALGDGLVSVASALGRHAEAGRSLRFAGERQWIGHAMNHWDLLDHPEVYAKLREWLSHA